MNTIRSHLDHTIMHEWVFRAGLDHWACFIGMVCAYNYPHYEAFLRKLEKKVVSQVKVNYSEHATKVSLFACL